jgi:hypothetical protein
MYYCGVLYKEQAGTVPTYTRPMYATVVHGPRPSSCGSISTYMHLNTARKSLEDGDTTKMPPVRISWVDPFPFFFHRYLA